MSEVLQQENAIILAVAEKLVSLGSEISQDLIEGKESKVKEKKWIKIFTLLTAYRKRATYSDDQLESILYDLRLLSEESVFPTVSPLVGQPIDYNINNGDDEVIGYASLASFPATGEDDTIYIDRSTDTLYRWDTVTDAYILVGGIGGGSAITVGDTQVLFADGANNPAGEAAFTYNNTTNTLDVDNLTVDDDAYDATGWNGSLKVPTKNAVRDKFESIVTSINGAIAVRPVVFDGMGAVILAGSKTYVRALFAGTITGWSIIADGSSPTCTLDIKKIATGTTLPSSSIVASDPPDLTTGNAIDSTSLTGWTTSIAAGDLLEISVTAATVMTKMEFALRVS